MNETSPSDNRRHHRAVLVRRILLGCAILAFVGGLVLLFGGTPSPPSATVGLFLVFLAPLLVFMDLMGIGTFFEETEPEEYSPDPEELPPGREVAGGVWSYGLRH